MTMESALIYVSRVTIDPSRLDEEVASIVTYSRAYNSAAEITGGLVRARGWFAQLLEGSTEAVETLMHRIARDPRHADVTVLRVVARERRRLGTWSMAYAGEWTYAAQNISEAFEPGRGVAEEKIDRLETMIVAFASA